MLVFVQAFWLFGIISSIFGVIYSVFVGIFLLTKQKRNTLKQTYGKGDGQDSDEGDIVKDGKEKDPELESFVEKPGLPVVGLRRDSPIGSSAI